MKTLVMRLKAPMQSWGVKSDYINRDTAFTPTKSGVVGLLACALGIERGEPLDHLNGLTMTVRVDNAGSIIEDFQVAEIKAKDVLDIKERKNQILYKNYIADANFLVLMEGDDDVIEKCAFALKKPVWQIFLGRKNCIPSTPVFQEVSDKSASELVESFELPTHSCMVIEEAQHNSWVAERRNDVLIPYKFGSRRKWGTRLVKTRIINTLNNNESHDFFNVL